MPDQRSAAAQSSVPTVLTAVVQPSVRSAGKPAARRRRRAAAAQPPKGAPRREHLSAVPERSPELERALRLLQVTPASVTAEAPDAIVVLALLEELSASDELTIADELAAHALAPGTRRAYLGHIYDWMAWCAERGLSPLPADIDALRRHLATYAVTISDGELQRDEDGKPIRARAAVTVGSRLAAIDKLHAYAGMDRPGSSETIRQLMAGLRRMFGIRPQNQRAALTLDRLGRLLGHLRGVTHAQLQEVVLLLLVARLHPTAGQLARLRWADVTWDDAGVRLRLPPSRRGGSAVEYLLTSHADPRLCPVAALRGLQELSGGLVPVLRGRDGRTPMTRQALHQRMAALPADLLGAGVNPARRDATLRALLPAPTADSTKARRDAALLLTGFTAALRCDNLVRLTWADLLFDDDGQIRVLLAHSKTDQEGRGDYVWLPYLDADDDHRLCPGRALLVWRDTVADLIGGDPQRLCGTGPVFGSLTPSGGLRLRNGRPSRLRADSVNAMIRDLVVAAGLHDPDGASSNPFGGHSLRVGFVTQAARDGLSVQQMQAVTKHKSLDVLIGYVREEDLKKNNPARMLFSRKKPTNAA